MVTRSADNAYTGAGNICDTFAEDKVRAHRRWGDPTTRRVEPWRQRCRYRSNSGQLLSVRGEGRENHVWRWETEYFHKRESLIRFSSCTAQCVGVTIFGGNKTQVVELKG